jgi:hypothetical protein
MGWLSGWEFRRNHVINSAPYASTNYQKRIKVHFGSGLNSGEDVYLDGKCKTDFSDIRFTDKTGITLLDYWMEEKVDGDYAIFWVEISEDLTYDRRIFVYYDNPAATSLSNGTNTFIFFDDFETDLSKWSLKQGASISTDYAYSGTKSLKLEVISATNGFVSNTNALSNVALHTHYYDLMSAEKECHFVLGYSSTPEENACIGPVSDGSTYEYTINGSPYLDTGVARTVGWHEFIIRSTTGLKQFIVDGNLMTETGVGGIGLYLLTSSAGGTQFPNSTGKSYWDQVFIRKWVNPEPVHGVWGLEETSEGGGITTWIAEDVEKSPSQNPLELENVLISMLKDARSSQDSLISLAPSLPYHLPRVDSEDVLLNLLAPREFILEKTFVDLIKKAYPIIGGRHIIQSESETE